MYTPSRRLIAATAALASALLLAGCASDDDPIASPSEPVATASASPSATPTIDDLCAAKVAVDAAFLAGGPPEEEGATPSPEQIGESISASFSEPYADLKAAAAGSEVEADVDKLVSGLEKAIDEGVEDFFFEPDFVVADKTVDDLLVEECGFKKISGTAADYEFTGLPTVSPKGLTALTITNKGEEFHEIILMKIDDALADESIEELLQKDEEELGDQVVPMGVVLASPGQTATNFFDLPAGRYAVLCFISEGSDKEHEFQGDGPPHFTKGMLEELTVVDPDASPSPSSSSGSASEAESSPSPSSGSASTSSEDEEETSSPQPSTSSS